MNAFWDLKIEAQNGHEARKGISAFERATGLSAEHTDVVQYWKMPEFFETRFETAGFSEDSETAIKELKVICNKIGLNWYEIESYDPDGGLNLSWIIDSRTSEIFIEQLFWVHCQFIAQPYTASGDNPSKTGI